jgi:hypothetical protein
VVMSRQQEKALTRAHQGKDADIHELSACK